jgi:tRNA G10  N-methylase Trm11
MQSLLILGRQPNLGLAEIESLYGPNVLNPLEGGCAILDISSDNIEFLRLGGSIKLAKFIVELPETDWSATVSFLVKNIDSHIGDIPTGKINLGISAYNFSLTPKAVTAAALTLKKAIQATGRSVRVVPNKEITLNSASVTHNKLTKDTGIEFLIIKSGNKTYVGRTVMLQDIKSYANRDQARPDRDARVGMLPPKLAQIIINLASPESMGKDYTKTVLDPFCGGGVILQESLLMGFNAIGSDIDKRMADSAINNLEWLKQRYKINSEAKISVNVADATEAKWPQFDFVATETSLGRPLSSVPDSREMEEIITKSNALITNFLKNLATQSKPGSKHCIAIPAWQIKNNQFLHLPVIDQLANLGYNSVDFKHLSGTKHLIYYRPDQVVARELLVIVRK